MVTLAWNQIAIVAGLELAALVVGRLAGFPALREDLNFVIGGMLSVEARRFMPRLRVLDHLHPVYE